VACSTLVVGRVGAGQGYQMHFGLEGARQNQVEAGQGHQMHFGLEGARQNQVEGVFPRR